MLGCVRSGRLLEDRGAQLALVEGRAMGAQGDLQALLEAVGVLAVERSALADQLQTRGLRALEAVLGRDCPPRAVEVGARLRGLGSAVLELYVAKLAAPRRAPVARPEALGGEPDLAAATAQDLAHLIRDAVQLEVARVLAGFRVDPVAPVAKFLSERRTVEGAELRAERKIGRLATATI